MSNDPGFLHVDFGQMGDLVQQLQSYEQQAQEAMKDMQTKLANGLAAWNGDARTEYETRKAGWDQTFAHLTAVLQQAGAHISKTNDTYFETETYNRKLFAGG